MAATAENCEGQQTDHVLMQLIAAHRSARRRAIAQQASISRNSDDLCREEDAALDALLTRAPAGAGGLVTILEYLHALLKQDATALRGHEGAFAHLVSRNAAQLPGDAPDPDCDEEWFVD